MDEELLELQRQFESVQQAKLSVRLSERNVVELVHKLQELRFIDFELLHTVSGKEYITLDQLRLEIDVEIKKSGRVSLIVISDIIGVDLCHVERQAQQIVADDARLMLIQGEILSQSYWDTVAEDINEKLQECSHIALAELAAQLHVSSELVASVLELRLGTIVKGRLEGGQLYSPSYVARVSAMVRGAVRGITVPTNLPMVWSSLQQEMVGSNGVSVEGAFFQSLFNGLVKEGGISGSLHAGVQWIPSVFTHAQRQSVDSFFSQNSFISYDVLYKLAIPQPKQYLQSRYPEGIVLDTISAHPLLVEMLDATVQDAIEHGSWIDSLSVLPAYIGCQDASKLLSLCPFVQKALKSMKAVILGESCIFSSTFIKHLLDKMEMEPETFSYTGSYGQRPTSDLHSVNESKVRVDSGQYSEFNDAGDDVGGNIFKHRPDKWLKKKRGRFSGSAKSGIAENYPKGQKNLPTRGKKNQRKTKDTRFLDVSDAKFRIRKGAIKVKEDILNIPSEEWVVQRVLSLIPDLGEFGVGFILKKLDKKLERALLHSYCKDLMSQINSETDPVAFLPKVHNEALRVLGRAISTALF